MFGAVRLGERALRGKGRRAEGLPNADVLYILLYSKLSRGYEGVRNQMRTGHCDHVERIVYTMEVSSMKMETQELHVLLHPTPKPVHIHTLSEILL